MQKKYISRAKPYHNFFNIWLTEKKLKKLQKADKNTYTINRILLQNYWFFIRVSRLLYIYPIHVGCVV